MPLKFPKFTKLKAFFKRKPKVESQVEIDIHTYTAPVNAIFHSNHPPAQKYKKLEIIKKYVLNCKEKAASVPRYSEELYQYDVLLTRIEEVKELIEKKQK
ncbi:MAG: hypothetical protein WCX82_04205 [archaeon]|jgi:hypothetical protein